MKSKIKITWNFLLLAILIFLSVSYDTTIYIFFQAKGQLHLLTNTMSFQEFETKRKLDNDQQENLSLIENLKNYSVDSLHYKPTKNFTDIYDQNDSPLLWVVTASEKFRIKPYLWQFPVVGKVSYKGFFDKKKALAEKNRLICS